MKVVKANEGTVYEAPNHYGMWGVRKFGPPEGAKGINVSISEFLPDGGAAMSSSDKERIYYVLRGSVTIEDETGNKHVLEENDLIHIPPGEKRSISVNGLVAAWVLVIMVMKDEVKK
ncbi:MAG: cupin domain-containing protein [Peptococcaceae bacterium]|nr:cupin domain-containing protein [Peptococcaceae bacterium]MDH7524961.1 cupin domain-containing protein [Peptococcaceae bacterium]